MRHHAENPITINTSLTFTITLNMAMNPTPLTQTMTFKQTSPSTLTCVFFTLYETQLHFERPLSCPCLCPLLPQVSDWGAPAHLHGGGVSLAEDALPHPAPPGGPHHAGPRPPAAELPGQRERRGGQGVGGGTPLLPAGADAAESSLPVGETSAGRSCSQARKCSPYLGHIWLCLYLCVLVYSYFNWGWEIFWAQWGTSWFSLRFTIAPWAWRGSNGFPNIAVALHCSKN